MSSRALARHRAVMAVMLGAPPAAVAADHGCDIATLMGWVKAQRQLLRRATRPPESAAENPTAASRDDDADGLEAALEDDEPADDDDADDAPPERLRARVGKRCLPNDRQVAPEDSALVEAVYRRIEFDYSGRRIRPDVTH
ncbi:MAG: hypothetical protein HY060_17460 [Proteobacteria bacterium]|nr:hypothetical protein [Pseudomonadota bacterium]